MTRSIAAALAGLVFGLGLGISQMVNPAKVLAFLDIAGDWDPSLAFVMGGAVAVSAIAFHFVLRRPRPLLAPEFPAPNRGGINSRLVGGAAVFGIGWGLVGFCPGPAIASLAYGHAESVTFLAALVLGMALARLVPQPPLAAAGTP